MSHLQSKQRRAYMFRPELLERRELLSTIVPPAHRPADVVPLAKAHKEVIKGSMTGTGSIVVITSLTGTEKFTATGTLTTLGAASLTGSNSYAATHNKIKYTNGTATLVDASGDTIIATFTGTGKALSTTNFTFKSKGRVTGGTGLYAGAAGTISDSGSQNIATGAFSITLTVTLKHT